MGNFESPQTRSENQQDDPTLNLERVDNSDATEVLFAPGDPPKVAQETPPAPAAPAAPAEVVPFPVRLLGWVLPFGIFVSVLLGVLYAGPALLTRWRLAEAESQAELAYQKRRAELKAEAEAAQDMLHLLDQKVHLTSLGFRKVVQLVTPKVVNISTFRESKTADIPGLGKQQIYDPDSQRYWQPAGVGSGLIVEPGYVLTNHHVVKKIDRLRVTFASGQSVWVDPGNVASDPPTDLAVIKLPETASSGLQEDYKQTAVFADSSKDVACGDLVLAIGSPLGLKHSVTHGVISAKDRLLDKVELLQTDTPINPGNSGGPLFDLTGRVVGINVAIASDDGRNQGIGFAIPSNTAKSIYEELKKSGEVVRGFIGVEMEDLSPEIAKNLNLEGKGSIIIKRVVPGFPAEQAGLQGGDIIVEINGKSLPIEDSLKHFRQRIMDTKVGGKVTVKVIRYRERILPPKPGSTEPEIARDIKHHTFTITVRAKPKQELVP